ncbi:hypothetical protein [Pseudomonas phage Astolliot]|nr:hypothetical protein [Pseudomonas phage Astolliot]
MIKLKRISIKNLMSVGNSPVNIDLDTHKATLITGKNGTGKSTILIEALTFALYGKPYRNINLPQLVNTTNKKGMLVKLEFEVGTTKYEITRGIGPKVFEIRKDTELLKEDASMGDFQDYLETKILHMSLKSFKQIVVLGTAGFVPFMQLTPAKRREVIEDLLDIQLLSIMAAKNKERLSIVQNDLIQTEHNIELLKQKQSMMRQQQSDDKSRTDALIAAEREKLVGLEHKLDEAIKGALTVNTNLTTLAGMLSDGSYQNELPALYSDRGVLNAKVAEHQKLLHFIMHNDNCPVCTQAIDTGFKEKKVFELDMSIDEANLRLDEKNAKIGVGETAKDRDQKIKTKIQELRTQKSSFDANITSYEAQIQFTHKSIESLGEKEFRDLSQQLDKIDAMLVKVNDHRAELLNDKYCYTVITSILKDSGVKTVIIGQYIPIINKLINEYLTRMGALYTFELDPEFGESVKTRGMENFSYNSFSEGQKYRIDLAILFAWRSLIKMLTGESVNLLVLDEVMDGSSDQEGIDALVEILDSMEDSIYVISHSEKIEAMDFNRTINVKTVGKFSEIEIST